MESTEIKKKNKKILLVKAAQSDKKENDFSNYPAPPDQVQLHPDDLLEEIAHVLTIKKKKPTSNNVCYSYKQNKWVQIPKIDESDIYFNFEGKYFFENSQDAQVYLKEKEKIEAKRRFFYDLRIVDDYVDKNNVKRFRVLKNDFNFANRISQTKNITFRDADCQTDAAKNVNFSDYVSPYIISRAYKEDFLLKEKLNQKFSKAKMTSKSAASKSQPQSIQEQKIKETERLIRSAIIIERMISQNNSEDIIIDYKFWDDEADNFRMEGSLLPLWKFSNIFTKKRAITAISWGSFYNDLFAVATGSYNFLKKTSGSIICFTLKNPNNPQYKIETNSSCMTIQFNPRKPYLLAAGFYDGSICIYDLRLINRAIKSKCYFKTDTKHYGPVWQVQWLSPNNEDNENFVSVGGDGRVFNWEFKKNILIGMELNVLKIPEIDIEVKYATVYKETKYCGTCIDFNSQEEDLYIVGTEEGKVLEYSSLHKEKVLTIFEAHSLSIYSIKWNPFFKRIFITCSADFSVKIWDHRYKNPMITYELSAPVSDVQWAPYSSTVFAALTLDGNIHIYDIYLNLDKPLCVQNITLRKKRRLTHVCFSHFFPILVVGDERGTISSFKLSPNLRSLQRDNTLNSISILNKETFEQDKIRNILSQEAELNPELIETNRKSYKFARIYAKKADTNLEDEEEVN